MMWETRTYNIKIDISEETQKIGTNNINYDSRIPLKKVIHLQIEITYNSDTVKIKYSLVKYQSSKIKIQFLAIEVKKETRHKL